MICAKSVRSLRNLQNRDQACFGCVTSTAPLSCSSGPQLTDDTQGLVALVGKLVRAYPALGNLQQPELTTFIPHYSSRSIRSLLQPLCHLTALTMEGNRPTNVRNCDLQPFAALSGLLPVVWVLQGGCRTACLEFGGHTSTGDVAPQGDVIAEDL
jgi:hypothetical protein